MIDFLTFLSVIVVIVLMCVFVWGLRKKKNKKRPLPKLDIKRHEKNPIISPSPARDWEDNATFNPAAVEDDDGYIHLLYRAIGGGMSRVGHAKSKDGVNFDERTSYPVFQPSAGFGLPDSKQTEAPRVYDPLIYTSGGGWGGCEDPRAVRIGDRVYMTYVAFGGWNSMRIAVTSISLEDLKNGRWKWKKSIMLSPPDTRNKNWVLFPEKINGKFAILHGISPSIFIDYADNLEDFQKNGLIKSASDHGGRGYEDPKRKDFWDNLVRGSGTPPMRTKLGWLFLYQAMDKNDPNKYKVGAMILDFKDPTKVLYRSSAPILSPEMHYENDGKPGVVYASGAVIKNNILFVYYGGGDKHVCVAQVPLDALLKWLEEHGKECV